MLKLAGSLCVLSAGGLVWFQRRAALWREMEALRALAAELERMAGGIRLDRAPVPRLLARAGLGRNGDAAGFFQSVSEGLRRGNPLTEAWRDAAAVLPLTDGDRRTVAELGVSLTGDEAQACKGIDLVNTYLRKRYEELEKRRPERERQSTALCFSAAALVIILLI